MIDLRRLISYIVGGASGTVPVIVWNCGIQSVAGIGYAPGAGGTVTQLTNKGTAVTLNELTGQITLNNAQLNAGVVVTFALNDTQVGANDIVLVQHVSGGTQGAYLLTAFTAANVATIGVTNITAGNLSEAIVIQFTVLKGTIT